MNAPRRVAFIHTGAVVIPAVAAQAASRLPGVEIVNYLDDRVVADLSSPTATTSVAGRIEHLARAARDAGAEAVMLTCSSISTLAASTAERVGIPVLRIDEAMADAAVAAAGDGRITVLATLPTTCAPTVALLEERAASAGTAPRIDAEVIEGAFAAVAAGDRGTHDELVASAIERAGAVADVVVLAQASMASAAAASSSAVPVLTSIALGVDRFARTLGLTAEEATVAGERAPQS